MLTPQQIHDRVTYVRRALERHWRLAAKVSAGVVLLTLISMWFVPRNYYSEAKLFVRFGRENLMLDPTATTGQMISIYESRENEINSLLEVLKSRAMLDRLTDSLSPEYILRGRGQPRPVDAQAAASAAAVASPPAATATAPGKPPAAHQQAVQLLERNIEIWTPRKSNIISVQCKAANPAAAQQITSRLIDIYLEEYVRVHQTGGSYQFFVEQTRLSQTEWQQATARLAQAKDKLGIVTIDGTKKQLQEQIAEIERRLLDNRAERETGAAKIASLEPLAAVLPEKIGSQQAQAPNNAFDLMHGSLFTLEKREQELSSRMQDDHPLLIAVRQRLDDLRTAIQEQRTQVAHAVNPLRQPLEAGQLHEQSQAVALRGQEKSLLALQQKLHDDLARLNAQEASFAQMQQDVDLAEARHKAYADKLEQARINRSLDEERISSLTVVQPASYSAMPSGPRLIYVFVLGLVVAALSGLGAALLAAYFRPVIATSDELLQLLELPLAGILPKETPVERGALAT